MRRAVRSLPLITLLAACGAPPAPTHGRIDDGFLSSYAHLASDPVRPDLFVWRLADTDFAGYRSVVIETPAIRRRPDDQLPSPEDRARLSDGLRGWLVESLTPRFTLRANASDARPGETLVIKTAITSALLDRGLDAPVATHHGWGEMPARFALECEVVDGANRRPLARMVSFDRAQVIPAHVPTPWPDCERDFPAWGRDASWLVQPPAAAVDPWAPPVPETAPASPPAPVST
jgi:hypothetical protein